MNMYIVWAAAIITFGVLEGVTAQLVSIWFVIGSVAAMIAAVCNAAILWQVIIFIAVSIIALAVTRPLVKRYIKPKIESTNADRIIGQNGIVTEQIDNMNSKGQVKIGGSIWTARSADNSTICKDSVVTVDKIDGVKLIVRQSRD